MPSVNSASHHSQNSINVAATHRLCWPTALAIWRTSCFLVNPLVQGIQSPAIDAVPSGANVLASCLLWSEGASVSQLNLTHSVMRSHRLLRPLARLFNRLRDLQSVAAAIHDFVGQP